LKLCAQHCTGPHCSSFGNRGTTPLPPHHIAPSNAPDNARGFHSQAAALYWRLLAALVGRETAERVPSLLGSGTFHISLLAMSVQIIAAAHRIVSAFRWSDCIDARFVCRHMLHCVNLCKLRINALTLNPKP